MYLWLCILYLLQFQWLLHQQHFLGNEHMNLRLKKVRVNSKNTNFKHFITTKILFSPLIGNIRLSLHIYINCFSSLFVVFFCCRWDISWFSCIVRTELTFLGRNLFYEGEYLNVDDVIAFCLYLMNKIINAVESHYLPFYLFLIQ